MKYCTKDTFSAGMINWCIDQYFASCGMAPEATTLCISTTLFIDARYHRPFQTLSCCFQATECCQHQHNQHHTLWLFPPLMRDFSHSAPAHMHQLLVSTSDPVIRVWNSHTPVPYVPTIMDSGIFQTDTSLLILTDKRLRCGVLFSFPLLFTIAR